MRSNRTEWGAAVVAALLFLAAWLPWHPARPLVPTADLYTHLSVARHLVRGEGFLNDVTYPLSFAYPFARELPQPLINRQPAFALMLTAPYVTAGRDPARTIAHTRVLHLVILGLIVLVGIRALQRHKRPAGVLPWFVLLGASPMLAFAVDWGYVELVTGLLMFLIWLRSREAGTRGPDPGSGLLWGLLILFRLELAWVPLLWWLARRVTAGEERIAGRVYLRQLLLAGVVAVAVLSPWLIRNARLTGQPFFTLQAQAELVKDTRTWPGYEVYRQLTPQPAATVLRSDPVPVLRKFARGVKFHLRDSHRFFPPLLLLGFMAAMALAVRRRWRTHPAPRSEWDEPALLAVTLLLLAAQYSFFDHDLRHLLVLLPLLAWETALACGRNWRWIAVVVLTSLLLPARLPGWEQAAREAAVAQQERAWERDRASLKEGEIYFFDDAAGPWFLDRPGVWRSAAAEAQVPLLLVPRP